MEGFEASEIERWVKAALEEDVASGDITTEAVVPSEMTARAEMRAREPLTVAGLALAEAVFQKLDRTLELSRKVSDGDQVTAGRSLLEVRGHAAPILTGERTALNFVQRLSGVATLTRRFCDAVQGTNAQILDTRKTTPGWRKLEKYAVRCGGGRNHREGLFDAFLIKDNHLYAWRGKASKAIEEAIKRARAHAPHLRIEVEVDTMDQLRQALAAGADAVLLDNMETRTLREAVAEVARRAEVEASGGVTLETVAEIAATGVDFVSTGALTHSARAVDIALDFVAEENPLSMP